MPTVVPPKAPDLIAKLLPPFRSSVQAGAVALHVLKNMEHAVMADGNGLHATLPRLLLQGIDDRGGGSYGLIVYGGPAVLLLLLLHECGGESTYGTRHCGAPCCIAEVLVPCTSPKARLRLFRVVGCCLRLFSWCLGREVGVAMGWASDVHFACMSPLPVLFVVSSPAVRFAWCVKDQCISAVSTHDLLEDNGVRVALALGRGLWACLHSVA